MTVRYYCPLFKEACACTATGTLDCITTAQLHAEGLNKTAEFDRKMGTNRSKQAEEFFEGSVKERFHKPAKAEKFRQAVQERRRKE